MNTSSSSRYDDMTCNSSALDCANSNHALSTSDHEDTHRDQQQKQQSVENASSIDNSSSNQRVNLATNEDALNQVRSRPSTTSKVISSYVLDSNKRRTRRQRGKRRSYSRSTSTSTSTGKRCRMERSFSRSSSRSRHSSGYGNLVYKHPYPRDDRRSAERSYSNSRYRRSRSSSSILSKRIRRRNPYYSPLPLEWWERSEGCKEAKLAHVDKIDWLCCNREFLVLQTTLLEQDTALEPNMFPYATPPGIQHYTLWSRHELNHFEIIDYVDNWLSKNFPRVRRWQYDDNMGERSILLFHVHVFIEMDPYSFTPRPGLEYFPPHLAAGTYLP